MRRFPGPVHWIRGHRPKEMQLSFGVITKQMEATAEWPMPAEAERAKAAIQKLACLAMMLAVSDMGGACSGERPLDQVTSFCPFGWGGRGGLPVGPRARRPSGGRHHLDRGRTAAVRWVGEIEAGGSGLFNLPGRSCALGRRAQPPRQSVWLLPA